MEDSPPRRCASAVHHILYQIAKSLQEVVGGCAMLCYISITSPRYRDP